MAEMTPEQPTFTVGTDLSDGDGKLTVVVMKHENGITQVIHSEVIQLTEPDEERLAMEAVMESVDPATWPGLTLAQRCALGRFAKPQSAKQQSLPCKECGGNGAGGEHEEDCVMAQITPDVDVLKEVLTISKTYGLNVRSDPPSQLTVVKGRNMSNTMYAFLKYSRIGRFLCWLLYGHCWDKTNSRQPMSREMNRCKFCGKEVAGPE